MRDKILTEAVRHGNTSKVKYRPAWLRMIVQSHLDHHGEDYYEEAKSIRTVTEHVLLVTGQRLQPATDPVHELAELDRLVRTARKTKKAPEKLPVQNQLNLL